MKSKNKYIGDEAFIKMLNHYQCPTPIDIVKMRFAGAICSPNMDLRPSDVISSFWEVGQEPRLQTKEEAELFFKFFMGLWDEILEDVKENKIKLPFLPKEKGMLDLYCRARYNQIEWGYIEGFWGGRKDLKIPVYVAKVIDSMSELAETYSVLAKKIDKNDSKETMKSLEDMDKIIEKAISFIIEHTVLPRMESILRVVN